MEVIQSPFLTEGQPGSSEYNLESGNIFCISVELFSCAYGEMLWEDGPKATVSTAFSSSPQNVTDYELETSVAF